MQLRSPQKQDLRNSFLLLLQAPANTDTYTNNHDYCNTFTYANCFTQSKPTQVLLRTYINSNTNTYSIPIATPAQKPESTPFANFTSVTSTTPLRLRQLHNQPLPLQHSQPKSLVTTNSPIAHQPLNQQPPLMSLQQVPLPKSISNQ